jgi:DNA-binding NarL/FixJ family response regulator
MSAVIRIMIVDDQVLFREALRTLLSVQADFEVISEAGNGEEALRLAAQMKPDVVLMDLRMPILDGVTTTQRMHDQFPHCKVIVLTTFDEDDYVFDGLRAGAVGYLLKDTSADKLFEAIRTAARGEYFLQSSITAKIVAELSRLVRVPNHPQEALIDPLSSRELEILRLVATGASNKEIAEKLVISEGTVKNHLSSILNKLSVKDRMQAVFKAKEIGII